MSKSISRENDSCWSLIESKFPYYSLKVPVKAEGKKIYIDVESAINSDQHYVQEVWNYCKGLIANNCTYSYALSSSQLLGILGTAVEAEIKPMTSDAGPLTDSWWMISLWLDFEGYNFDNILYSFKKKYPDCQQIVLTTSEYNKTFMNISVYDDCAFTGFKQLKILGGIIDISDTEIV